MKKIKNIIFIFLFMMFIPFVVKAETCVSSCLTVESIEISKINGNALESDIVSINGKTISFNLEFYNLEDSIEYNIVVKNNTDEDYYFDEESTSKEIDYLTYEYSYDDGTNIVKAGETKSIRLYVEYKTEVLGNQLVGNVFNINETVNLPLTSKEKDNIIETLKNPETGDIIVFCVLILLLCGGIILVVTKKKEAVKYLVFIISAAIIIPICVYALCKCDITIVLNVDVVSGEYPLLYNTVRDIANNDTCVAKYNGNVTDEVGKTVLASNVYFDSCEGQRNIIFGGYCWEVIRTTDTKGTKVMYNGEPVNGKCLSSRNDVSGIGAGYTRMSVQPNYLFGSSYTFNPSTRQFTIKDTFTEEYTKENLSSFINKYSCFTESDTCSQMYLINGASFGNNNSVYTAYFYASSGFTYKFIGLMPFNSDQDNISSVGYMFNEQSSTTRVTIGTKTIKYASSFTYDEDTKSYTLTGESQTITDITSSSQLNNTRYTCLNESGECEVLRYVLSTYYSSWAMSEIVFIDLTGGDDYLETMNKQIKADDINKYNSTIKMFVDDWYKTNLIDYGNKLENTVYCNNRETVYNSFENGTNVSYTYSRSINFKQYDLTNNIDCSQVTDQFSVNNEKAKLTYPVGLITAEELKNIDYNLIKGGYYGYWTMTPGSYDGYQTYMYWVSSSDFLRNNGTNRGYGVRPVISLKHRNYIVSGSGSESDPWIIG